MTRDELLLAIEQAIMKEREPGHRAHIQYNEAGCAALLRVVNDAINADRRKRMTLKERVLDTLAAHPEGLTTVEVRKFTGGGIGARDTVYRLYNAGVLERTAPQPTPTGGVQYRYRLKS